MKNLDEVGYHPSTLSFFILDILIDPPIDPHKYLFFYFPRSFFISFFIF